MNSSVRAVVCHGPRDLRIEDVAISEPGAGEVRVKVGAGGICGSDLHYYNHGGFGTVRIREPMVLGHEAAGVVLAVGSGVTDVKVGDRVAINPSKPCGSCDYCRRGLPRHCVDMRFNGSAMRFPHMQGIFRDEMVIEGFRAVPVGDDTPIEEAAFAEPLSVALHAVSQAGPLLGKRVLVTGTGTIGCLVVAVARHAGAAEIIATDVSDGALAVAKKVGANRVINVAEAPDALSEFAEGKGGIDVAIECSGNGKVLASLPPLVRPCGRIVMVGLGGDQTLPVSTLVAKEIELKGSFRFDREFEWAAKILAEREIDVRPLLSGSFPIGEAEDAFALAGDRNRSIKVQLRFAD